MEGRVTGQKPITEKRKKILEMAFAQLRKSRAAIDPKILSKIRRIVASSPAIMQKLGVTDHLQPDEDMPLSTKVKVEEKQQKSEPITAKDNEKIDQARNMEVMAKLMALKPSGKDKIKSAIKKAVD